MKNFIYVSDKKKFGFKDHWQIMKEGPDGFLRGDCEDFALTKSFYESEKSLIRFFINIVTCKHVVWLARSKTTNTKHAVLYVKGKGYIDNIYPFYKSETPHKKILPYLSLSLFLLWGMKWVINTFVFRPCTAIFG